MTTPADPTRREEGEMTVPEATILALRHERRDLDPARLPGWAYNSLSCLLLGSLALAIFVCLLSPLF
jgi:hypothetical protein